MERSDVGAAVISAAEKNHRFGPIGIDRDAGMERVAEVEALDEGVIGGGSNVKDTFVAIWASGVDHEQVSLIVGQAHLTEVGFSVQDQLRHRPQGAVGLDGAEDQIAIAAALSGVGEVISFTVKDEAYGRRWRIQHTP